MLFPHLKTANVRFAAAGGALISVVFAPFVPIGLPILAAGLAIFVGLRPASSSDSASANEAVQ